MHKRGEILRVVRTWLSSVRTTHSPMLLLVGLTGSGKTRILRALAEQYGHRYLNLNLTLGQTLQRTGPQHLHTALTELAETIGPKTAPLLVDHIEVLFTPALRVDPLLFLHNLSRHRPLIVAWQGRYEPPRLTYAVPGHPEFREYLRPEQRWGIKIVSLGR